MNELTPLMQRVMKLAEVEASRQKAHVGTQHVLIGMIMEGENYASNILKDAGITIDSLRHIQPNPVIPNG